MKLEAIYEKDINRTVNPAVSASDFSDKTVKTEIEEYVFTDEIINGLYKILSAIKNRNVSHYNRQIKKFPTEKQNVSLKHILT